jgi:hypothetical protein
MREFDALRAAAQTGTTFDQYDYKRREQAFTVRALKQPIGEDAPIHRHAATATAEPTLPTEARLADGSLLKPRPILVCGQVIWPAPDATTLTSIWSLILSSSACCTCMVKMQPPIPSGATSRPWVRTIGGGMRDAGRKSPRFFGGWDRDPGGQSEESAATPSVVHADGAMASETRGVKK